MLTIPRFLHITVLTTFIVLQLMLTLTFKDLHLCAKALRKTLLEILIYTECPRRNVPNFGRVFLMLKYTDITQNTYIQS